MIKKFRGCLLGLAVGDALGAPVEFLKLEEIKEKYGPGGIQDFDLWDGFKPGSTTDETQLSLATAKACINAFQSLMDKRKSRSLDFAYLWYQDWLQSMKDPFRVRRPGYTTMHVLQSGKKGVVEAPINDSTEPSGLLRTAPVGLTFPPGMAFREGADFAALTHGNPSSYLAGGFLAESIAQIIAGKSLQDAVELALEQTMTFEGNQELLRLMELAMELFIVREPVETALEKIGKGMTAGEVLAMGIFCCMRFVFSFQEGLIAAVNHSGASPTTGAVTGAVSGALLGSDAIPEKWVTRLEDSSKILEIAEDMYMAIKGGERISFEKYRLD